MGDEKEDLCFKRPVFTEELSNMGIARCNTMFYYLNFETYYQAVERRLGKVGEDLIFVRLQIQQEILNKQKQIVTYQEEQKQCVRPNSPYCFSALQRMIDHLRGDICRLEDEWQMFYANDYEATRFHQMQKLLELMREYYDKGYIVIPYYYDKKGN